MKYLIGWILVIVLLMNACKKGGNDNNNDNPINPGDTSITGLPPVESGGKVGANQQPASPNQTRVAGVRTLFPYKFNIITSALNHPWGLAILPNGDLIVTERSGAMRIVNAGGTVSNPIANVPAVRTGGESGLLDVKLDPDFSSTRFIFFTYIEPVGGNGRNCVGKARLSDDASSLENVQVIFRGTTSYSSNNHNGSRLLFDQNGLLFVSFGEAFDDNIRIQAQQLSSSLGKVIRISKDGTAGAGNPYLTTAGALPAIFSLGHRNPQGLAIHPVTGALWESEHGPQAGDEINLIQSGHNYGWPTIAYGLEYSGQVVGEGTQKTGLEQPIYYWDPAIAPSGMTFYTGTLIPEWHNNLFVAALKGQHIVRLVLNDTYDQVVGEERILADQGQRFRNIIQSTDGSLYAITDMDQGRIYRISN